MIDQDKIQALAAKLRGWNWMNDPVPQEAADAIDLLLAEVEAAAADKRDARTALTRVKELVNDLPQWKDERHTDWSRGRILGVVEIALAQRQGERS
ncbi:hypothetical protein [Burkholderia cenocepacia]|uniref:hypothetical protein n=1 Tax=Burkholderia cenocepacia TaxID=95486 RepID=UPI00075F6359|nr:hypothetical protein [Burkholderia cenocepacia]AOK33928.1 hypothetical protein WL90_06480 [Burkholderia cenocepacia]KWF74566.1 hypothetical protein WL89_30915 [Burkholderia cenocepacia]